MADTFQPYVGPRPFERTEADRNRFFGRDDEASELLSCVIAHPTLLLYSQSGAGKTSLINAKLTPMLEKAGLEVLKSARVGDVLPEGTAPGEISNIYAFNVLRNWDEGTTDPKKLARTSLSQFLKDRKTLVSAHGDPMLRVAIFDQFEELFTSYQERREDGEGFLDQVGAALEGDRSLRVVFAMREDYIAEMDPYLSLLPEKLRTRYRIERLSKEDALLAVIEPLRGSAYSYADGVAEQLVENLSMVPVETASGVTKVRGESVDPVQLQVVCQTLWDNCRESWEKLPDAPRVITPQYLEDFGDVDEALSGFYEKAINVVTATTPVTEGQLRRWFERNLITSAGTRGTVFRGPRETGELPNAAIDELVKQHIIRAELRSGSRWYELTHDRFIAPIRASNARWLLARSGAAQTPQRLEAMAQTWADGNRQRKDLIQDEGELREAERWLESDAADDVGYSTALLALVQASRSAANEKHARSARRLRLLVAALALMVILLIAASIVTFKSLRSAQAEARAAQDASAFANRQTRIADEQTAEAQKQKAIADAQAKDLEKANILIQGKQILAEQAAGRARTSASIAKRNQTAAEELNKAQNSLSKDLQEAENDLEVFKDRPPAKPEEQCKDFKSIKVKYLRVASGYETFEKVAERNLLRGRIEGPLEQLRPSNCPD
jgi:hypothetical protein